MATQTSYLGLTKPANGEAYSVSVQNGNMDKIDAEAKARNQGQLWADSSLTFSQFIADCDARMDGHNGIVALGYVNAVVTNAWGLPINGWVIGLVNGENYRRILIISSGVQKGSIAFIVKSSGTWDTVWKWMTAGEVLNRHSGITWSTYATAANNPSSRIALYKEGRTVHFAGYFTITGTLPIDTPICVLPEDCRPIINWRIIAQRPTESDQNQARGLQVQANGEVRLHNASAITGGFLNFEGSWISAT